MYFNEQFFYKKVNKNKFWAQRAALENNLVQVSVSQEELKKYVSLTTVQTKGLKRYLRESEISESNNEQGEYNDQNEVVINTLKGAKKRRLALVHEAETEKVVSDPNVLGLDVSSNLHNS